MELFCFSMVLGGLLRIATLRVAFTKLQLVMLAMYGHFLAIARGCCSSIMVIRGLAKIQEPTKVFWVSRQPMEAMPGLLVIMIPHHIQQCVLTMGQRGARCGLIVVPAAMPSYMMSIQLVQKKLLPYVVSRFLEPAELLCVTREGDGMT